MYTVKTLIDLNRYLLRSLMTLIMQFTNGGILYIIAVLLSFHGDIYKLLY